MKVQTAIIGNGVAGFFAAKTLRQLDPQRSISIITHENEYFYSRPLITNYLTGELKRSDLTLSSVLFYQEKGIDLIKGMRVSRVDLSRRRILLQNRTQLTYDQLLIASGGVPQPPGKMGFRRKGIYPLRTLLDAERIREVAQKSKNALVVGGGLVGMKAVHALNQLGLKTTVIVSSSHILSKTLDARAARMFQTLFEEKGTRFFFNEDVMDTMERTSSKDQIWGVITKHQRKIQGDFLVVGKGVRPNVDLFKETPLTLRDGIVVDRKMKTNLKNVFAAGDVAEAMDLLTGKEQALSLWPNAAEQGKIAAYNMAGQRREYPGGLAMNAFEFYGLSAITMGLFHPPSRNEFEEIVHESPTDNLYQKWVLKGNRIVGAIFLQDIQKAGIVLEALKKGTSIENLKTKLMKRPLITEQPFIPMEVLF